MHREKFGERLRTLFEPETEAAIKAMESGMVCFTLLFNVYINFCIIMFDKCILIIGLLFIVFILYMLYGALEFGR